MNNNDVNDKDGETKLSSQFLLNIVILVIMIALFLVLAKLLLSTGFYFMSCFVFNK